MENDTLSPREAALVATNAYFALKDALRGTPTVGVESAANLREGVLGGGRQTVLEPGMPNPTLRGSAPGSGAIKGVFQASTGLGTETGFGYLLQYQHGRRRHVIVAVRGTSPQLGAPDLLTDLRGSLAVMPGHGPVHKGFKRTFDSALSSLGPSLAIIDGADQVHLVGHSLGGAVATLMAAHFRQRGKAVKLYTFGSPRVGAFGTYASLEQTLGKDNIFRVSHDLDPISLVGPFPFIHVNPSPHDANNMTLVSPTGALFSVENHKMARYIASAGQGMFSWDTVRNLARQTDHDNIALVKALLHGESEPSWVQRASGKTLGLLFKMFSAALAQVSTAVILQLSALDMLAEMLMNGLYRLKQLGAQVLQLLGHAAEWAGIAMGEGAEFTASVIRRILDAMLAALRQLALEALTRSSQDLLGPLPLLIGGGMVLSGAAAW